MSARFHINSIDQSALALTGYKISLSLKGEVISVNAKDGSELVKGEPEFERVMLAAMNKPRALNAHELSATEQQGMTLTDDEAEIVSSSRIGGTDNSGGAPC